MRNRVRRSAREANMTTCFRLESNIDVRIISVSSRTGSSLSEITNLHQPRVRVHPSKILGFCASEINSLRSWCAYSTDRSRLPIDPSGKKLEGKVSRIFEFPDAFRGRCVHANVGANMLGQLSKLKNLLFGPFRVYR